MNFKRHKPTDRLKGDIDSHEWRRAATARRIARQARPITLPDPPEPLEDDYAEPWLGWDDYEGLCHLDAVSERRFL